VSLFYFVVAVLGLVLSVSDWLWNGPSAYVGGLEGRKIFDPLTPTGFRGPTNVYAELPVPAAVDWLRAVCFAVALAAAVALLVNRFSREVRLPRCRRQRALCPGARYGDFLVVRAALPARAGSLRRFAAIASDTLHRHETGLRPVQ
jgi:hypothetical protein